MQCHHGEFEIAGPSPWRGLPRTIPLASALHPPGPRTYIDHVALNPVIGAGAVFNKLEIKGYFKLWCSPKNEQRGKPRPDVDFTVAVRRKPKGASGGTVNILSLDFRKLQDTKI